MIKIVSLSFFVLLTFCFCGCAVAVNDSTFIDISYETQCGFTQRYSYLHFNNDGEINYEETYGLAENPEDRRKLIKKNISRKKLEELAQLIKKTGFFGFQNEYSQDNLMDGVTRILTVTIDKKTKTVRCYEKSPPGFIKIEETLEDIFKEAQ